ncbi:hypothetical protein [Halomonas sp. TG39a]|uniref:hypothetical protein n=1 Tax=Halomonas sp. TG39a TaxID=1415755 RepID=UPI003FA5A4F1
MFKGKTTVAEVARQHDLTVSEVEGWIEVSAPITTSSQSLFRGVTSLSTAKAAACSVRHRC